MDALLGVAAQRDVGHRGARVLICADSRACVVADLHAVDEGEGAASYTNASAQRWVGDE